MASIVHAADQRLPPGEYITEGGWGTLLVENVHNVDRPGDNGQQIGIEALGANGHSCSVEGVARGGVMVIGDSKDDRCRVTLTARGRDIQVDHDGAQGCRAYCGMRADFDGLYLRPLQGCDSTAMKATRDRFKRDYQARRYAQARNGLQPLLQRCQRTLGLFERWEIRNDLAVTAAHLQDKALCRSALQPLLQDLARGEEAYEDYPPLEHDLYRDALAAARFNARLCGIPVR